MSALVAIAVAMLATSSSAPHANPAARAAKSALSVGEAAPALRQEVRGVTLAVSDLDLSLTSSRESHPFFSYRAHATEQFARDLAELSEGNGAEATKGCVRQIEVTPIAWAGVLLSVRESVETSCPREAHPAGSSRFVTFAIVGGHTATAVSLTRWIDAGLAFASLRKDTLVRRALGKGDDEAPRTLPALVAALADSVPVVEEGKTCYTFPGDLTQRFAPSHLEGRMLALRLSLPGAAVCRERLTQIGILVPTPRALAPALAAAAAGRAGFLVKNVPAAIAKRPLRFKLIR